MTMCKVHKALLDSWKALTDPERKPFELQSQESKLEYDEYMSRLGPSNKYWGSNIDVKKPISSFFHYMRLKREVLPASADKFNSGEMQREWRAMTDEEKAPYLEMGRVDRERYEKEKKEWEAKRVKQIQEKRGGIKIQIDQAKKEATGGEESENVFFGKSERGGQSSTLGGGAQESSTYGGGAEESGTFGGEGNVSIGNTSQGANPSETNTGGSNSEMHDENSQPENKTEKSD